MRFGASALTVDSPSVDGVDIDRPSDSVLFVFARSVDAVLGAGGTIAMTADSGASVTVLSCLPDARPLHEVDAAMELIGVRDHRILGSVGARMRGAGERRYEAPGGPASLGAADPGEVAADIATVIATVGARTVVGGTDDARDPDSGIVARAARHAALVMDAEFSSVVGAAQSAGESASGVARVDVDIRSVLDRKRAAIDALGGADAHTADRRVESFASDARFTPDARERPVTWAEFGTGTRIASLVIGLVVGAVVGALGTVVFQSGPTIGGVPIPLGLIGSLLVVAAILAGLRLVFATRAIAAAAAVGLLGMIGLFSLESPGGSVLIPDLVVSYYWLYGPVVLSFIILGWPHLARLGRVRIASAPASRGSSAP